MSWKVEDTTTWEGVKLDWAQQGLRFVVYDRGEMLSVHSSEGAAKQMAASPKLIEALERLILAHYLYTRGAEDRWEEALAFAMDALKAARW